LISGDDTRAEARLMKSCSHLNNPVSALDLVFDEVRDPGRRSPPRRQENLAVFGAILEDEDWVLWAIPTR
jgi:hypothetical protein